MSFSLVPILASAFAIVGAYATVKGNTGATATYDIREMPVKTYTQGEKPTVAQAEATPFFNNYAAPVNLFALEFTAHCTRDAPYICLVQVKVIDGVPNSIISYLDGDFH